MKQITQIGTLTSLAVWLLVAQTAAADSPSIWNGGGNDNNWNNAANWNGNLPVPGPEYDLQFGGTIRLTPFNDFPVASDFRNITFNAGAGAFTLGGNAITLSGDIANESTNPQTLNLGLALTGMRTVTTATGGGDLTLGGDITGAGGGLVKQGAGTLTLSGANTYADGTTNEAGNFMLTGSLNNSAGPLAVTGGKMTLSGPVNTGSGNWLVSSGEKAVLNITSGAQIEKGGNFQIGNLVGFNGALNISGGSLTSTQAWGFNNFSVGQFGYGALNMSGGDVISAGFMLGSGNGTTGIGIGTISGGTFTFTNNVVVPYYAGTAVLTVTTNGSLTRITVGNLNVNQRGNGRGELNVTGGNVDVGVGLLGFGNGTSPITGGSGMVNLNAGSLAMNRFSPTTFGSSHVNFNGGTLRANASRTDFIPLTLTSVYVNGPFGSYAGGVVIDTADFAVTAAAPLRAPTGQGVSALAVTDGGSGYIGAPYVKIVDSGTGFGATAIAHMVDDGTGAGTLKVDRIEVTNPGVDYTAETTGYTLLGGAPTIAATPGAVSTAANTSAGLTKLGTGTLTLSGTNTYAGPTIIREGTLTLNPGGNVDVFSAIPAVYTPSNIVFDGGTLSFSRAITLNARRGIYLTENGGTIAGASASGSAAPIEGPGALTKIGNGRLSLYGPSTFAGGVNLVAGKIRVNNYPTALGVGPLTISGGTLVGWRPLTLINDVIVNADFTLGSETADEVAPLTFTGSVNLGDATRTITIAAGTAHTFAGVVSGNAGVGLTKAGAGALTLTAANTYTGETRVEGGRLVVSSAQSGGGSFSVYDGTILGVVRDATAPTLTAQSLSLIPGGTATLMDFVFPTGASAVPLVQTTDLIIYGTVYARIFGGNFTPGQFPLIKYTGSIQGGGAFDSTPWHLPGGVTAWISNNTANSSIDLVVTGAAATALTWSGAVSPTWDYSTLNWWTAFAVNTTFGQGDSVTLDDTAITNTAVVLGGALAPAAVVVNNTSLNYSLNGPGALTGAMSLSKEGSGLLTVTATNTYTGGTVVNAGTLRVANQGGSATGSGAVTVQITGVLDGNGFISGPVTVGGGGVLSPGNNTIGALTVNNTLTLGTGSATVIELNQAAGTNDVVNAGTLYYGGALLVTNLAGTFTGGETYQLFNANSYNANFATTELPELDEGLDWNWNPATGTLSVSSGSATTPTNITYGVSDGTLTLSWPESHLGWYAQSNAVSVADANAWYDIAGSQAGTSLNIILNPALPQVYYRLRQP